MAHGSAHGRAEARDPVLDAGVDLQLGVDQAGVQAADANALAGDLAPQALGQRVNGVLGMIILGKMPGGPTPEGQFANNGALFAEDRRGGKPISGRSPRPPPRLASSPS